jgi:NAD(P)-dependent dehydrogenase (short-subunit alcohol dehydrogenase family)
MSTFTLKTIHATMRTMTKLNGAPPPGALLDGAVVIVTGAGRGIGRAHARALAAHGARVVANDISGARDCVERLAADGLTAWADTSDISTWDGARSLIGATVDRFGALDGLVNNAGVLRRADVADLVEEDLDLELGVNLKGAFACTRFASQYWRQESRAGRRRRASVVNTASDTIFTGSPGGSGYAATKAAIVALTQSASLEGAQYGVRHNAIAPSGRTPMAAGSGLLALGAAPVPDDPADQDPAAPDNPQHNAPLVVWLLSPESAHVNGQVFRLRFGAFSRMNATTNGEWLLPPDDAAAWPPEQIGDAVNGRLFRSQFPPPMRDFPNQPSVPFSRLDHS